MSQVGEADRQQDELQPGDLVFFNTMRRAFSHVGIYLGDNHFVHAPRSGAEVRIEDMGRQLLDQALQRRPPDHRRQLSRPSGHVPLFFGHQSITIRIYKSNSARMSHRHPCPGAAP